MPALVLAGQLALKSVLPSGQNSSASASATTVHGARSRGQQPSPRPAHEQQTIGCAYPCSCRLWSSTRPKACTSASARRRRSQRSRGCTCQRRRRPTAWSGTSPGRCCRAPWRTSALPKGAHEQVVIACGVSELLLMERPATDGTSTRRRTRALVGDVAPGQIGVAVPGRRCTASLGEASVACARHTSRVAVRLRVRRDAVVDRAAGAACRDTGQRENKRGREQQQQTP